MLLQIPKEQHTDMQRSQDITCDTVWLREQTDRLLAFEVLYKEVTGYPNDLQPSEISEKVGSSPTMTHDVLQSFIAKFKY